MKPEEMTQHVLGTLQKFAQKCQVEKERNPQYQYLDLDVRRYLQGLEGREKLTPVLSDPYSDKDWAKKMVKKNKGNIDYRLDELRNPKVSDEDKAFHASEIAKLALRSTLGSIQYEKITLFGDTELPEGAEKIVQVLKDQLKTAKEPKVQCECIGALGRFGGNATVELLSGYLMPAEAHPQDVRRSVISALGRIGGERSALVLCDHLLSDEPDGGVRSQTLRQIGGLLGTSFFELINE